MGARGWGPMGGPHGSARGGASWRCQWRCPNVVKILLSYGFRRRRRRRRRCWRLGLRLDEAQVAAPPKPVAVRAAAVRGEDQPARPGVASVTLRELRRGSGCG